MNHNLGRIITALLRLTRPLNVLITGLSILVAALISGPILSFETVILACISASCIMAAGNTINDYYDIEIDRINKPERPLPSGAVSLQTAWRAAIVEFLIGIAISAFLSPKMLGIASIFSVLIYLYAVRLKRTVLWGNITVSIATAAAFIYGGLAVQKAEAAVIPAIFAFLFHCGREIIKDMEDVEGDRRENAVTFPIRHGFPASIRLITAIFTILIAVTILPFATRLYGITYMVIVAAGVHTVLLYVLLSLRKNTEPGHLHFLSNCSGRHVLPVQLWSPVKTWPHHKQVWEHP